MKKKNAIKRNMKFLLKNTLLIDKGIFYYFGIVTIVSAIIPFIGIITPKILMDELTTLKRPKELIIILITFFVISAILNFLESYLNGVASARILNIRMRVMNDLQRRILVMDFKDTENPETLNKIESDFENALGSSNKGIEAIYRKFFELGGAFISFLGYSTIILTLNPIILIYLIFNVVVIYFFTTNARKYEYSRKEEKAQLSRRRTYLYNIMYDFSFGKDIRVFDIKKFIKDKYMMANGAGIKIEEDIKNKKFIISLISIFLLFIREGLAYSYLVYMVSYKDMTIGDFTMYFATIASFASFIEKILDNISQINTQNLYISDFVDFMEKIDEEENKEFIKIPKDKTYEVEFKNVSFKYPNSTKYIMKNLSLKIEKGQRLAIVGVNGAGKTTFIKLLTRLYDLTEGEILLNGINIKSFNKKEYFKIFSVVFQEIKMFSFSIAKNIGLVSEENIDKDRVKKVIEQAGMTDKINSLEKGIETTVLKVLDKEGIELSGGENQRIALARALYKNGEVIILDEPTAALDAIAEYNIYRKFDEMIGDKTAIYISHRLSSTKFCDVIAFFEDGEIKEYGSHEELLSKNGRYAEMFNIQASYYKNEEEVIAIEN